MATLTEDIALLKNAKEGNVRLKQLDGLLNPHSWRKNTKLEDSYNNRLNLDQVLTNYNIDILETLDGIGDSMVDTLTNGLYETAGERLNNIKELQSVLESYEQKLIDSISLNKDTINYCLVVLTLLLSIYVPNMGAAFTEEVEEFDMFLFLVSSTLSSLPTIWLMCESIYALILLSNMTENFLTFKHYKIYKDEKGNVYREHSNHPDGLGYVARVYDVLQGWMPVIMTFGALTLLFYINNNTFKNSWWTSILFFLYSIGVICLGLKTLFIFGHDDSQQDEDNEKSIVGFLIHFFNRENLYNIDTDMSISSIVQFSNLYNKTLRSLLEEHCKFYSWLDRIVMYDAWERKVEKKLKYVRKLEEVIEYRINQKTFQADSAAWQKIFSDVGRRITFWKNAEAILLYDYEGYQEYDIASLKGDPKFTFEKAIGEKFRISQDILDLEKNLFKIQNLQLKCKSLQRQSKAIVKTYQIDPEERQEVIDREERRRQEIEELKIHEKNEFWRAILPTVGRLEEYFVPLDVEEHLKFIYGDEVGLNKIDKDFPVKAKMIFFILRIILGILQLVICTINVAFLHPYYALVATLLALVVTPWLTLFVLKAMYTIAKRRMNTTMNDIANAAVTTFGFETLKSITESMIRPPTQLRSGFRLASKLETQFYIMWKKYIRMWQDATVRAMEAQREEANQAGDIGEVQRNQSFATHKRVEVTVPIKKSVSQWRPKQSKNGIKFL